MSSKLQQRVREVFNVCLRINSTEQRAEVIERECNGDLELKSAVMKLLEAHDVDASYLERPLDGLVADQAAGQLAATVATTHLGTARATHVGPYKIREQIGEGGMGVVYVAEQSKPIRRKVALKIIKPGVGSAEVIARFEAERQALAMMDHPNIASVFDGGTAESGQPFFVMELVQGLPITEYCDQHKLSPRERLHLLEKVCRAVQHAHQKGIIHRDLKPSNVLVAEVDGQAVPKVIDFGIAKATSQKLTEQTIYTQFSQMVGTPMYMSPEQAGLGVVDIDTRSDVYSLGVLTYELLTGNTPFAPETLKNVGVDEFRRVLREVEPRLPSSMVSTLRAEALSTVAGRRDSDPRKLAGKLRGELDWIVMKSLEKDRNRRYESASALAADIVRYLNDEPVEASPPSRMYRMNKFVRRHRAAVLSGTLVCASLLVATGISLWRYSKEKQARAIAQEQGQLAQKNLHQTLAAVESLLGHVAESRLSHVPHTEELRKQLLNDALQFCKVLLEESGDDPEVKRAAAVAYLRIGTLNESLGDHQAAEEAFRTSIAMYQTWVQRFPNHPLTASAKANLAGAFHNLSVLLAVTGRLEDSLAALKSELEIEQSLTQDHPEDASFKTRLATASMSLADQYRDRGRLNEAEIEYRRALQLSRELVAADKANPLYRRRLGLTLHGFGDISLELGRPTEAASLFQESLKIFRLLLDEGDNTPELRSYLANVLRAQGLLVEPQSPGEAELAYRESEQIKVQLAEDFPELPDHAADLAAIRNSLANVIQNQGRIEEVRRLYDQAFESHQRLLKGFPGVPKYRSELSNTHTGHASYLQLVGEVEAAVDEYQATVQLREQVVRDAPQCIPYRVSLAESQYNLAVILERLGRPMEALAAYQKSIDTCETTIAMLDGSALPLRLQHTLARSRSALGGRLIADGKHDEGLKTLKSTLSVVQELVADRPEVIEYAELLAELQYRLGKHFDETGQTKQAEDAFSSAVASQQQALQLGAGKRLVHLHLIQALTALGKCYKSQGRLDEAAEQLAAAAKAASELVHSSVSIIEDKQRFAQRLVGLGDVYRQMGQFKFAKSQYMLGSQAYDELSKQDPEESDYAFERVQVLKQLGLMMRNSLQEIEESQKTLELAIATAEGLVDRIPDDPRFRSELAACQHVHAWGIFERDGQRANALWQQAISHQAKARDLAPNAPQYANYLRLHYESLAESLAGQEKPTMEDLARATELIQRAFEIRETATNCQTLGWIQYRQGKPSDAVASLEKSIQLAEGNADSYQWFVLAMALAKLGETDKAREWKKQAEAWMLKNDPNDSRLIRFRAELIELLRD